ncbi:hypothetical protein [Streptomyces atratus]|uniref:hypothetical protein n=1 Tax=Streptomyces atratus TaxID=1893 RepID=UPI00365F69CE
MTTARIAPDQVWRPYSDDPLLTPAMAQGYAAVPPAELAPLRRYLEALVAGRRAPIHASVAFNAAYFGYDLEGDGYGASPLDPDAFPGVTLGERVPALPVGAMVHITTGSQPLFAEIVYKEGRHPAIGPLGDAPGWVSGAPAGAEGPGQECSHDAPVRRELLVPDPHAFGDALSLTSAQLIRLRGHQRWMNRDGHVLVDSVYPSKQAAESDDASAYADYLLTTARDQLLSPVVPLSLNLLAGGQDDRLLHSTLVRLLDVIRQVLVSSDKLRMWGSYAMTCDALAERWRDSGPLGGGDMSALAAAVQHAAKPEKKRRYGMPTHTVHTAVGPSLRNFPGAGDQLMGVGYAAAVCRANLALGDVIRGESENGLFATGTRVCLDDAFEGGGIWRSRYPGDTEDDDPLVPAGLGWLETTRPSFPHEAPVLPPDGSAPESAEELPAEPIDAPLEDEHDLGPGQLLRIADSEVAWRMSLRLAHLIDGYLPLRTLVADELRHLIGAEVALRLELSHPGGDLDESEAVQDIPVDLGDGTARLLNVDWPIDFFPGLELHLQWPRGGRVVRATTTLLETPVVVDDRMIEHRYDPAVLTREDPPGSSRTGDSAAGLDPRRLVMRTVRRCGLLTPDGHALLDRSVLPTAAYGQTPAADQIDALLTAADELLSLGQLQSAIGSRGADGRPRYPARPEETEIPLIEYTPAPAPAPRPLPRQGGADQTRQSAPIALQYVPGHLRRLLPGNSPSDLQRAAFREHCRQLGKAGSWELPHGYTFVIQHTRGT